ncbi:hypothetical protein J0K78_03690 [Halobacillus sp. GSS1]|uniref:hypothetical protein n=1 Tax=Halobacillus sp. GSS1 TaxID=2815919 RepID=UPI001A8E8C71|nr:hypothetical protein [Halobacillus sp. GSS1]MBN9653358.1 hypothetical protein [Halobacillus sp. GSS1]
MMSMKSLSISSALLFILTVFPLLAGLTRWGNDIFTAVLNISIFLPLIFGVLGLAAGLFGIKGRVKVSLVVFNLIGICLSSFLIFVAVFGFKQP